MEEIYRILIGIIVLITGYFLGGFLAKITKEELKQGRKWFKLIILVCVVGSILSLVYKNDVLFFTFLFIAIVTSRSLRN